MRFVDEYLKLENTNLNRNPNAEFIEFLYTQGVITIDGSNYRGMLDGPCIEGLISGEISYECKPFCKKNGNGIKLYKIINSLKQEDGYFDPDLLDDIYSYGAVVTPYNNSYEDRREHAEVWGLKFASDEDEDLYYKGRVRVFAFHTLARRLAILYRDTAIKAPYEAFKEFYKSNETYVKGRYLRVDASRFSDQLWTAGLHEWLECQHFIEALEYTSGERLGNKIPCLGACETLWFRKGAEEGAHVDWPEFNWLDFQFLVRSQCELVIFRKNLEGHTGAIANKDDKFFQVNQARCMGTVAGQNSEPKQPARPLKFLSKYSGLGAMGFSTRLRQLFNSASTPYDLMHLICEFYDVNILHDETSSYGSQLSRFGFTATGVSTRIEARADFDEFRKSKLGQPHYRMQTKLRDLWLHQVLLLLEPGDKLRVNYSENSYDVVKRDEIQDCKDNHEAVFGGGSSDDDDITIEEVADDDTLAYGFFANHLSLSQTASIEAEQLDSAVLANYRHFKQIMVDDEAQPCRVIPTDADGNCGFSAVARCLQLLGHTDIAKNINREHFIGLVNTLGQQEDDLFMQKFIQTMLEEDGFADINTWTEHFRSSGYWLGSSHFQILSRHYGLVFHLYHVGEKEGGHLFLPIEAGHIIHQVTTPNPIVVSIAWINNTYNEEATTYTHYEAIYINPTPEVEAKIDSLMRPESRGVQIATTM